MPTIDDLRAIAGSEAPAGAENAPETQAQEQAEPAPAGMQIGAPAGGEEMMQAGVNMLAKTVVANAIVSLEDVIPLIGSTSDLGKAIDKAIKSLSKHVDKDLIEKIRATKTQMTAQALGGIMGGGAPAGAPPVV